MTYLCQAESIDMKTNDLIRVVKYEELYSKDTVKIFIQKWLSHPDVNKITIVCQDFRYLDKKDPAST